MSKKTLNAVNLAELGVERLANLLIEVSSGSAEIKRRLRLELSHNLGPEELARDVRKRLTSIRRSKSFVGWRKRRALIKDLNTQAEMIIDKIAPDAPAEAFDLLWQFIELAPSVYARVDDSKGDVSDVFRAALETIEDIALGAGLVPRTLAAQVWGALCDNDYGQFDGLIELVAPALGDAGLEDLKALVLAHEDTPLDDEGLDDEGLGGSDDHAALQFLRDLRSSSGNFAVDQKSLLIQTTLQQIAAAQGDIDAYIAQYSDSALTLPSIAAEVAELLLAAGRPEEALDRLTDTDLNGQAEQRTAWDAAYVSCLLALNLLEDAQDHRWACFCDTLDMGHLRDHLKVLPDFDDIEVEDEAKVHALQFESVHIALQFFLAWPDLVNAAQLIESRAQELDGGLYETLTAGAEALRGRYPLAAVILWRVMIEHTLYEGRVARYGAAGDHLMDCAAADMDITDYGRFPSHQTYIDGLRNRYDRKASFWARLPSSS
jgi:hypothetical protein